MPVVDASVVIKWFVVDEVDSDIAHRLLESHANEAPLVVPDLVVYEVANALLHNRRFDVHSIQQCLQRLYDLELEVIAPSAEMAAAATALASTRHLTFYDAIYVQLALHFDLPCFTADLKLLSKVRDIPLIKSLSAFR